MSSSESLHSVEREHSCIFCQIIRGDSESSLVERNKDLHVLMSLEGNPIVIPNKHIEKPNDDPALVTKVFEKAVELIPFVEQVFDTNNYNIISNTGRFAGQEVSHFHVHIIPRHEGDRLIKIITSEPKPRAELDFYAERMRDVMLNNNQTQ